MSKASELIAAAREHFKVPSNYALAPHADIPENRLHDYEKGKLIPDEYAIAVLALAIGRDPLQVLAEIHAEVDKSEKKRNFWRNFLSWAKEEKERIKKRSKPHGPSLNRSSSALRVAIAK